MPTSHDHRDNPARYILGISAFYHDSAAALLHNGKIVAAAQEERFTRRKGDPEFPSHAVDYCLSEAGIRINEIDALVFYDKPLLKFDRILETYLSIAPQGYRSLVAGIPIWLKQKFWTEKLIRNACEYSGQIYFGEHHESHAASAFYPSPFEYAAILTVDGVGEWATTCIGRGNGNEIELSHEIRFPHSLGLLYSAFTYYLGFKVNSGEYKVMGLAPYGSPKFTQKILDNLIDVKPDGSFRLNMRYFNYLGGLTMTHRRFADLFGAPRREPESALEQFHMDMARSLQDVTELILVRLARHAKALTGERNLCLAGGVALNCVANGKILREGIFDDIWIQPASGDAGGALGAALAFYHRYCDGPRLLIKPDLMSGSYLGPEYNDDAIETALKSHSVTYEKLGAETIPNRTASAIANGAVVGWFQGRMEYGPRALGARSILGDPRNPGMQSRMNLKIKYRESFRPFAPVVKEEKVSEWFDIDRPSPYMLLVADVTKDKRTGSGGDPGTILQRLKAPRSVIQAVTHLDFSARLQTIARDANPLYWLVLDEFETLTGCPVLVNTSYNVRGEPIVRSPEDAITCFLRTEMDHLAIGSFWVSKTESQRNTDQTLWREDLPLD